MLITDWGLGQQALLQRVKTVLSAGVPIAVQHRHPHATTRQFESEARALALVCAAFEAPLFINGRLDLALLLDAHVHLPAHGFKVSDVRPLLPSGRWVCHAVHDVSEAQPGADLALLSPVFAATSKPTDVRPALGPQGFSALAARITCPSFALGGITSVTAQSLPTAAGFAAIGGLCTAADALALHRLGDTTS